MTLEAAFIAAVRRLSTEWGAWLERDGPGVTEEMMTDLDQVAAAVIDLRDALNAYDRAEVRRDETC